MFSDVAGKNIPKNRRLSEKEKGEIGWDYKEGLALQLEDGAVLFASVLGKNNGKMFVIRPKHQLNVTRPNA